MIISEGPVIDRVASQQYEDSPRGIQMIPDLPPVLCSKRVLMCISIKSSLLKESLGLVNQFPCDNSCGRDKTELCDALSFDFGARSVRKPAYKRTGIEEPSPRYCDDAFDFVAKHFRISYISVQL